MTANALLTDLQHLLDDVLKNKVDGRSVPLVIKYQVNGYGGQDVLLRVEQVNLVQSDPELGTYVELVLGEA